MCFHIRKSADRSLFAAPRSLSQLVTSFIGSWCQGIRPMLLFAWTSLLILFSLFSWIAEFLKQIFSQQKSILYLFCVSTFRWNCNFTHFLGKTKLISQFCPLKSVRFLLIFIQISFEYLYFPIRLSRFMFPDTELRFPFRFRFTRYSVCLFLGWSVWMDSNHRPHAYQACALTTWATDRYSTWWYQFSSSWWRWWDSNPWPPACRAGALPTELHPH